MQSSLLSVLPCAALLSGLQKVNHLGGRMTLSRVRTAVLLTAL